MTLPLKLTTHTTPQAYEPTWQAMKSRTEQAAAEQADELWLMTHEPVFTQGRAGKAEHILNPHNIPVVQTDRGGQVTYHGPGQLMLYSLLNIERLGFSTRRLVRELEKVIIDYLSSLGISAECREAAPGIYVDNAKIASIGLRVSRGFCYHGMAFNIDMDLTPFQWINPCGYQGQAITQLKALRPESNLNQVSQDILPFFTQRFGYSLC